MPWFFGTKVLLSLKLQQAVFVLFLSFPRPFYLGPASSRPGVQPCSLGIRNPSLSPSSGQVTLLVYFLQHKGITWSIHIDWFWFREFQGNLENDQGYHEFESGLGGLFPAKGKFSFCLVQSSVVFGMHRWPIKQANSVKEGPKHEWSCDLTPF